MNNKDICFKLLYRGSTNDFKNLYNTTNAENDAIFGGFTSKAWYVKSPTISVFIFKFTNNSSNIKIYHQKPLNILVPTQNGCCFETVITIFDNINICACHNDSTFGVPNLMNRICNES